MKALLATGAMFLLTTSSTLAQKPATPAKHVISANALHRLDSLFHYLDTTGFYNGNILVAAGGAKKASASIGYANLDTKERLTELPLSSLPPSLSNSPPWASCGW